MMRPSEFSKNMRFKLALLFFFLICSINHLYADYDIRRANWGMSATQIISNELEALHLIATNDEYVIPTYKINYLGQNVLMKYYCGDNGFEKLRYEIDEDFGGYEEYMRSYVSFKYYMYSVLGDPIIDDYREGDFEETFFLLYSEWKRNSALISVKIHKYYSMVDYYIEIIPD